jgi:thiamine biosynthesis lipoprotein
MQFRDTFFAMNTDVETIVESDFPAPGLVISVKLLFDQQEERFSRFREGSLVSRLNRGEAVRDGWLAEACRLAIEAHQFTGGLFNPMVLPALTDAGYGASFEQVAGGAPRRQPIPDPRECLSIEGDDVELRHGRLDLGGIVKGWTAELAVGALAAECPNVFVNAGGDIRCIGSDSGGEGWEVRVEAPIDQRTLWEGRVRSAIATSTTMKRRWKTAAGGTAHHLIDPRTGLPSDSPFVQVTAWGKEAWRAECWAKAVLIGGVAAAEAATAAGMDILTLDEAGATRFVKADW